mgnify:CR=1 FL=1
MLVLALGCAKDKSLDDNLTDETDETAAPVQEQLEPVGVIPADDCQHVDFGDKACNFRLWDQNEDTWDLYEHKGDVILLDFSTSWCPPCQSAGHYMQALQDTYGSEGVQIVTILIDGPTGGTAPTPEDIDIWVSGHGITTAPVLQGSRDKMFDTEAIEGYSIGGFPTYIYIGRDMTFYAGHVGFSEDYVKQKIEEGL